MLRLFLSLALTASIASPVWAEWKVQSWGYEATSKPSWYRCYLQVGDILVNEPAGGSDLWRESMTLTFRSVPAPFQVWLNGQSIYQGPALKLGENVRFKVPKGLLKKGEFNALVVQVQGNGQQVELEAPVFSGYLDEVVLSKPWQVSQIPPKEADWLAIAAAPSNAFYVPADWQKARTVLQATKEPERGEQVAPSDALARMKTPEDLKVESLLHEPQVAQPTHLSYDERGRLWVAQYRQYPYPAGLKMISRDHYYRSKYDRVPPAPPHHDKGADIVTVHEDKDGDGILETSKTVLSGLNMSNAAIRGYGGIWVMHTPYLMFYPDANGDDIPDAEPEVRLSGFGFEDTHSTANGLIWGPDGWLYGAQGSTVISHVMQPEHTDRAPIYFEGCGAWRYHPEKRIFEVFADGSGNTFGLHFDAEGRMYSGHNGGNTRGWHLIQEGPYIKQGTSPDKFGPPTNPYGFKQLDAMRTEKPVPRFTHNVITIAGTAMPAPWQGMILGADPLHQHLMASPQFREGSTFFTKDHGTALQANDRTFRPVYLINAPDGSVTIADFREQYIAHGQNYQGQIDPDSGRIYRLRGKDSELNRDVNLDEYDEAKLLETLAHPNLWHRHTAVRLLAQKGNEQTVQNLRKLLQAQLSKADLHPSLEALWAITQLDGLDDALALQLLAHSQPMLRAWVIRLQGDDRQVSKEFHEAVLKLVANEADAEVRLQVLSTARRLPVEQSLAWSIAVLKRDLDVEDRMIPVMAWYALEDHTQEHRDLLLEALTQQPDLWKLAISRQVILPNLMRRYAASGNREDLVTCAQLLKLAPEQESRQVLMQGFELAYQGRALTQMPTELVEALAEQGLVSSNMRIRQGDREAVAAALKELASQDVGSEQRQAIARVFGEIKVEESIPVLLQVALEDRDEVLRKQALASLSLYEQVEIGQRLLDGFNQLSRDLQDTALNVLCSRVAWTQSFLSAVEEQKLSKRWISADLHQRLKLHASPEIQEQLARLNLEEVTRSEAQMKARIEEVRNILASGTGDPYAGEPLYMERCAACHKLFYKGGDVGPNLTTYQREDLGTMLVSIIDPNAEIREGYINQFVTMKDGRTMGGFLADQDAQVVVLRGFDGSDTTLQRDQIAAMQGAGMSMMPEGLLDGLTDQQMRDLFAYLRISQPITK